MKKLLYTVLTLLGLVTLVGCQTESTAVFTFEIDPSFTEYITLGTSADYAPYEWLLVDEEGNTKLVGFDIELAKEIAKAAGKNLRVINKGFDFLLDDLQNGKVDFVISGMTPTPDRAEKVDFSEIYFESKQAVVINKADAEKFTSIDSLNINSVKVGAQLSSLQEGLTKDNFPQAQHLIIQSVNDLLFNLQEGKVNAIVLEAAVATGFVSKQTDFMIAEFAIGNPEDGAAVAVQKGNTALLNTINEVIASVKESGKMDQFVNDAILLNS